jgi:hypothetical protein
LKLNEWKQLLKSSVFKISGCWYMSWGLLLGVSKLRFFFSLYSVCSVPNAVRRILSIMVYKTTLTPSSELPSVLDHHVQASNNFYVWLSLARRGERFSFSWFRMTSACVVHNSLMKSCTFGCRKAHADCGSLWALEVCQSRRESCLAGTVRNFERYWTPNRIYITHKEELRTVQRTQRASIRQTNRWMLVKERGCYIENQAERTNTLCGRNADFIVQRGGTYSNH